MCLPDSLASFFNNATVGSLMGAFIGAAGAVFVVVYTDRRRERQRASVSIPALLDDLDELARIRLERAARMINAFKDGHAVACDRIW